MYCTLCEVPKVPTYVLLRNLTNNQDNFNYILLLLNMSLKILILVNFYYFGSSCVYQTECNE